MRYRRYLEAVRGLADNTVNAYISDLWAFSADTGINKVGDITRQAVTDWMADNDHELSDRTQSRRLTSLKTFVAWAVDEQIIDYSPIATMKRKVTSRKIPKYWTKSQMRRLLDHGAVGSDPITLRDRAVLELLYSFGPRVSELCALDLDTIDPEDQVAVLEGKGDRERTVPVGVPALHAVQAYLEHGRPHLDRTADLPPERRQWALLLTGTGRRMYRQEVARIVSYCTGRVGVPDLGPHGFRDTAATHLLKSGADIRYIQELLGHASVRTTQIYTHVAPEDLIAEYRRTHPRAS